jgi:hypothetical protein
LFQNGRLTIFRGNRTYSPRFCLSLSSRASEATRDLS